MELRAFRWSDLEGAFGVRATSAGAEGSQTQATPQEFARYWRRDGVDAERDLWVVEEAGEILACGGLRPWNRPGWLQADLDVRADRRRQGLGSAMLGRLVAEARGRGMGFLAATVPDQPPEVGGFLRRRGFQAILPRQHMRLRPIVVPQARLEAAYRLRMAAVAESAVLASLTNAAYGEEEAGWADATGYRRYVEQSGAQVWVAEQVTGGQMAGLCEVYGRQVTIDGASAVSGHIASLAVHPAHRQRGLGRSLLAAAIGLCLEAGWPSVELNVDRDNLPARSLYESAGLQATYGYTVYRLAL